MKVEINKTNSDRVEVGYVYSGNVYFNHNGSAFVIYSDGRTSYFEGEDDYEDLKSGRQVQTFYNTDSITIDFSEV